MAEFPKKYKFDESEKKWCKFWKEKGTYLYDQTESRDNTYVIDTPPPGVSGHLHIGHVYSYTHTDFIARYQRMKGKNVFYPIGFDDNGLPTERLVEKKKKIRANQMQRTEFVKLCHEVIDSEEQKIRDLFNNIALSMDSNLEYQTISDKSCKISQLSFLDLLKKDQIYRNAQPMLWDPVDQTALAQAEIEDKEQTTFMNDIQFQTEDGEKITIATTRPELLPACVAVFYHPDDKRYQKLEGKFAISPLFEVRVPLLQDDMVDPEKGTGLVMCCTFGDQTDVQWWQKHKLPTKIIITKQGNIDNIKFDKNCANIANATKFADQITDLKIKDARSKMIQLLKEKGLLLAQTEKLQTVKCAERSGVALEILTTPQWFIRSVDHKDAMFKRSNELNWYPKSMKIKLDSWINAISLDWCISRQRYFGVPFPIWYSKKEGEEGKLLLPKLDQLPVDPLTDLPEGYEAHEVEPDIDVMDTWATSSVSPQLNTHGIADGFMVNEERHKKLFPVDLRPQAHEIIRSWAYYTMLKAHLHSDSLPWQNIMISGWCLASDKTKMSKSKGNIIDPKKLLNQYGADVVRYWAASSRLGVDTAYSEDVVKNGKRLVNKLWNAAKFVSQHFDKIDPKDLKLDLSDVKNKISSDFDKYFLSLLTQLLQEVSGDFDEYEYALAMNKVEKFFWSSFCDNYLEITKSRAYNENDSDTDGALSAILTLYHAFKVILKLFAAFMPHITEEIYNLLYSEDSIHERHSWPKLNLSFDDLEIKKSQNLLLIVELVRKIKAHDNLSVKAAINHLEIQGTNLSKSLISDLKDVTSAKDILFVDHLSSDKQNLTEDNIKINVIF